MFKYIYDEIQQFEQDCCDYIRNIVEQVPCFSLWFNWNLFGANKTHLPHFTCEYFISMSFPLLNGLPAAAVD